MTASDRDTTLQSVASSRGLLVAATRQTAEQRAAPPRTQLVAVADTAAAAGVDAPGGVDADWSSGRAGAATAPTTVAAPTTPEVTAPAATTLLVDAHVNAAARRRPGQLAGEQPPTAGGALPTPGRAVGATQPVTISGTMADMTGAGWHGGRRQARQTYTQGERAAAKHCSTPTANTTQYAGTNNTAMTIASTDGAFALDTSSYDSVTGRTVARTRPPARGAQSKHWKMVRARA